MSLEELEAVWIQRKIIKLILFRNEKVLKFKKEVTENSIRQTNHNSHTKRSFEFLTRVKRSIHSTSFFHP